MTRNKILMIIATGKTVAEAPRIPNTERESKLL